MRALALALALALFLSTTAHAQYGAMEGRKNPGPYVVATGAGMGVLGLTLGAVGLAQGFAKESACEVEGFCLRPILVAGGSLYVVGGPVLTGGTLITRNWYRDNGYVVSGLPAQVGLGFGLAGMVTVTTAAFLKDPGARNALLLVALPGAMSVCYVLGIVQVVLNRSVRKLYRADLAQTAAWNGRVRVTLAPVGVAQGAGLGIVGVW
jgi:hypothetical protein